MDIDFQCISAIPTGSICIVTSWVVVFVRSYDTSEVVDIWFGNFLGKKWRQGRKAAVNVALNRIQIASTQRGGELQGLQGLIKLLAQINFQFLLNVKLKSEQNFEILGNTLSGIWKRSPSWSNISLSLWQGKTKTDHILTTKQKFKGSDSKGREMISCAN